jgi:hypothetical protein
VVDQIEGVPFSYVITMIDKWMEWGTLVLDKATRFRNFNLKNGPSSDISSFDPENQPEVPGKVFSIVAYCSNPRNIDKGLT